MIILRYIFYIFACQLYCLRLGLYFLHQLLIILASPGARFLILLILLGSIYFIREPVEVAYGEPLNIVWNSVISWFTGSDLYGLMYPYRIEITLAVIFIVIAIIFGFISSTLRLIMGVFSAPVRPLPPLPPFGQPNTKIAISKAKLVVEPRTSNEFSGNLSDLTERLPEHLREVIKGRRVVKHISEQVEPVLQQKASTKPNSAPVTPPSAPRVPPRPSV